MRSIASISALAALLALAGCATMGSGVPVARLAAPLKTALLSAEIGAGLDDKASALAAGAEYRALEAGRAGAPVAWKASPAVFGSVVPQQPFTVGATNCRRYTHTISVDGRVSNASATACRGEDGVWAPLS